MRSFDRQLRDQVRRLKDELAAVAGEPVCCGEYFGLSNDPICCLQPDIEYTDRVAKLLHEVI